MNFPRCQGAFFPSPCPSLLHETFMCLLDPTTSSARCYKWLPIRRSNNNLWSQNVSPKDLAMCDIKWLALVSLSFLSVRCTCHGSVEDSLQSVCWQAYFVENVVETLTQRVCVTQICSRMCRNGRRWCYLLSLTTFRPCLHTACHLKYIVVISG